MHALIVRRTSPRASLPALTLALAAAAAASALAIPRTLAAQRVVDAAPTIAAESHVRVFVAGQRAPVVGTVLVARADTIVLQTGEWREGALPPAQLNVPTQLVRHVDVQVGVETRTASAVRYGAIGGAAAGIAGALMEAAFRHATGGNSEFGSPFGTHPLSQRMLRTGLITGVAGAWLGAVVGGLTPRPVWRAASLPQPDGATPR